MCCHSFSEGASGLAWFLIQSSFHFSTFNKSTRSRKYWGLHISKDSMFRIKGRTSAFTLSMDVVLIFSRNRSKNSSFDIVGFSQSPESCARWRKCSKFKETPLRIYHSISNQSRPFTRFCHSEKAKHAFYANDWAGQSISHKEKGRSDSFSQFEIQRRIATTSILILIFLLDVIPNCLTTSSKTNSFHKVSDLRNADSIGFLWVFLFADSPASPYCEFILYRLKIRL